MLKALNATLNRRRLLLGLAAASTAAATSAAIASVQPVTPENAELLRLGDMLPGLAGEHDAASAARSKIVRKWLRQWPAIPGDALQAPNPNWASNPERDLTGRAIEIDGHSVELRYLPGLEASAKRLRRQVARKRPNKPLTDEQAAALLTEADECDRVAQLVRDYRAECDRVREASGYELANARREAAQEALTALVGEIIRQPAETMDGVLIKAEALNAFQSIPLRVFVTESWDWPGVLAADVLRIAARSA